MARVDEEPSELERAVLDKATSGDDPVLTALREQLDGLRVVQREYTGVGFYAHFAVRPGAHRLPSQQDLAIGDVHAELDGLSHGGGFVLFVRKGLLATLEGFTYDEPWPDHARVLRLSFVQEPRVVVPGSQSDA